MVSLSGLPVIAMRNGALTASIGDNDHKQNQANNGHHFHTPKDIFQLPIHLAHEIFESVPLRPLQNFHVDETRQGVRTRTGKRLMLIMSNNRINIQRTGLMWVPKPHFRSSPYLNWIKEVEAVV